MDRPLIHIGLHKTGSSTIQAFLARNAGALAAAGIAYPLTGGAYGSQHSELALALLSGRGDQFEADAAALMAACAGAQRFILSGEAMSRLKPDSIEPFTARFAAHRPRILLYVRNLYELALSNLSQRGKTSVGFMSPAALDANVARLNLRRLIRQWERAFGPQAVEVRAVDQLEAGRDLIDDFIAAAGLDGLGLKRPPANVNQSIDYVSSLLLNGLMIETGLRHHDFYDSYRRAFSGRPEFGRVRALVFDMLADWVERVDIDHPKLAPFAEGLKRRPEPMPALSHTQVAGYARSLALTLKTWADTIAPADDASRSAPPPAPVPIVLDLSRLYARAAMPAPTGIDRIEFAWLDRLVTAGPAQSAFAVTADGGPAAVSFAEARALRDHLAEVWLDGRAGSPPPWPARLLRQPPSRRRWLMLARRWKFLRAARYGHGVYLNLSHYNLERPGLFAALTARGLRPAIYIHDLIPVEHPGFTGEGDGARHDRRIAETLRHAAAIAVNSQATAEALRRHAAFAAPGPPLAIAPPGADGLAALAAAPPAQPAPARFVMLGSLDPRKNHGMILDIFEALPAPRPRLLVIGRTGKGGEAIADRLTRLEGTEVSWPGPLGDRAVAAALAGATAVLMPSRAEGYGMPIAEALALGVPVLASDLAAHREAGGAAAAYLPADDAAAWRDAILAYAAPDSPVRAAHCARLADYQAPAWAEHFAAIDALIGRIANRS